VSGIDMPLKVSSMFGVFSGALLISSSVTFGLKLELIGYWNIFFLVFIVTGVTYSWLSSAAWWSFTRTLTLNREGC
jgi:hypothetical protein